MNKKIKYPTLKTAFDAYAELTSINSTSKITELLLFHLFILKHLFNSIKLVDKRNRISPENAEDYIDVYRSTIAKAFCLMPLGIMTKEKMCKIIELLISKDIELTDTLNGIAEIIIDTFNYNFDLFYENKIPEYTANTIPIGTLKWLQKKAPNLYNTDLTRKIIIDFSLDLNGITQEIKKYAKENNIKIQNIKPITNKTIISCKNNKILEICFIFVKYYLQENITYRTIYKELNLPYTRALNKISVDTKIRKISIPLLNRIISNACIRNLKKFRKSIPTEK